MYDILTVGLSYIVVCLFVCLRTLQGIQDFHDLLLDDLGGIAGVWDQISGQEEDKDTP